MDWNTACLDWEDRILSGRSLVPTLPLFEDEAARAVRVFNRLRIPDIPGRPTFGEAGGDWFRDIVAALFGAFDPAAGRRHIQEVFLLVPKKNSKSSGAAGVMMTGAILNRRPEAELLLIAPTKEIADIAYGQADGMVRADAELDKLFHRQHHIRTITHRRTGAMIKIKAADTDVITGGKQTFTLIDETHVFAAKSRAAEVFIELRGALAARPDGFLMQITTQSKSPPAGVFKAELQKARDVRDGKRRLPLLPVLYELPLRLQKEGAWRDPKTWALVNPNMGRSVDPAFLAREMANAEETGEAQTILFASQHLNVEIGLALGSDRWAGADHWLAAVDGRLDLNDLIARSEVVVVGIDGGGLDDLLGLTVLGRERDTRRWLSWSHAWANRCVLERRKEIAPRLLDFEQDGDLTIVDDGSGDDVEGVVEVIERIEAAALLPETFAIGVDPAGIIDILDALARAGFDADPQKGRVAGIRQGSLTLNTTVKTAERRLAGGDFVHADQPLMAWCVGNARVEARGNAVTITKQAAGMAKIDPLMALFNAVALMVRNPEARGRSVYEDADVFV
jgi:phage terminase large subunit-like protein